MDERIREADLESDPQRDPVLELLQEREERPLRVEDRARVRLDVALEERGREVFSPALNLSASGAFVATPEPPEIGSQVRMVLSLPPNGVFVRLYGEVVRHASTDEPNGFGVTFVGVDERSSRDLRSFVHTCNRPA